MAEPVYLLGKKEEVTFQPHVDKLCNCKLTSKQRKQLQHEFKIYLEKYFKSLLGKCADYTKVTIWGEMVILRGEGFLTEPEKYIASTPKGSNLIKVSRLHIAKQCANDNISFFEEKLGAKCIHQTFDVESNKDFWIHVMVFDQLLIEE